MSERNEIEPMLTQVYEAMEGSELAEEYSVRHGIDSAAVLTVYDDETAGLIASYLAPRIEGRVVVEIGGGIGLLAMHLAMHAKRVYCIEANPMWSWTFATVLLAKKPKNLSYLFGAADEFVGRIRGNVALFCTHSDKSGMKRIGERFADTVIDVYGEIIAREPDRFDPLARVLRDMQ
jgi:hypothetical protein